MRVVLVAAPSDIHCIRWANALNENNIDVHICYVSNHKPRIEEIDKGISLHELKFAAPLGYYFNKFFLKRIISNLKPDILHVHYASGYGTLGRLVNSKEISILSVYGSDIYDFPYKNKLTNLVMKKNLSHYLYLGSTSEVMARQAIKVNEGLKLENIHITPFGVDVNKFKFERKKIEEDKVILGSIKKLEKKYGIEYAIKAIDIIVKQNSILDIEYHIYGEGSQEAFLKDLTINLGLEEYIFFHKRIKNTEVPSKLREFDFFIAPSILDSESFGVSVVEAMATGVPVIASDVDGFREVLDYGYCGEIVEREKPIEIAKSIIKLIENENLRNKYSVVARERVEKLYSWDQNVNKMISIYKEVMENN
ncbi:MULTISPECIES: glycosyltransferase [Bacteria]|uniref:glycosyltransferase n=1 Tax=Bacteria TaxID=2 RepID=UPI00115D4C7D|nr:glycosyltransferase [Enterococcus casseliflavus]MBZ0322589.1 glycosyltransferase [Enterococcus casseliflavus]WBY93186.1 glycosyltransferase [Enterococcus casseliflavus]